MPIRPATEADIPAIMAIERSPGFEAFVGRSDRAQHEAMMAAADQRYIILEDETGPLGFAILQGIGASNGNIYLKRIAVGATGKGLGKKFLSDLIRMSFTEFNAEKFWLDAFETNSRAQHVYASCGLRHDGTLREHYPLADGSRANLVIMSILKREWVDEEAQRSSRVIAEADSKDPHLGTFMDAALADLADVLPER